MLTLGETGAESHCLRQFAKSGARVIALTSNDVKAQLLSALGADHVINYFDIILNGQ